MSSPLVICKCGCLSVSLVADVTRVRLVVRVNHMMLVQTGILCESLIATNHLADIWPLACVNSRVILVICRTSEGSSASLVLTNIGSFTSVRSHVYFSDIRGCK